MKRSFLFWVLPCLLLTAHTVPAQVQKSISWLDGTWKGTGYQAPTQTDWAILLEYNDATRGLKISYPSLNCSGKWNLVKKKKGYAEFVEVITEGTENCDNNVKVVVTQIDERFVNVAYFLPELFDGVVAYAVLENTKFRKPPPKIRISKKKT